MMNEREKSDSVIVADEAGEQSGAFRSGVGRAKDGDQGKRGTTKHAPSAGSGKRVTGVVARTESREGKEEGEVHGALPPPRRPYAAHGLLRTEERRRARRRWRHVGGYEADLDFKDRRSACAAPSRGVPGAARTATVHPEAGRKAAPAGGAPPAEHRKRALSSVRLRDVHSPARLRPVRSPVETGVQVREVALAVRRVLRPSSGRPRPQRRPARVRRKPPRAGRRSDGGRAQ